MSKNKLKYTISIESAEAPGGLPTGTIFTMELSVEEADTVRRVAQASREALVSSRFDPAISISETIYCDDGRPCFLGHNCEECIIFKRSERSYDNG